MPRRKRAPFSAPSAPGSRPNELDVTALSSSKDSEVVAVEGNDVVTVLGKQGQRSIDDVQKARTTEKLAGCASQCPVDSSDVKPAESLRQPGLPRSSSPYLSEDPGVSDGDLFVSMGRLEPRPHRPFVLLECDQGGGVEDERHADCGFVRLERVRLELGRRRTTMASARSARRTAAISAEVISPNSDS